MNWYHVALALAVNAYLLVGLVIVGFCLRITVRDWQLIRSRHPQNTPVVGAVCATAAAIMVTVLWPWMAWQWWGPRK